jgi:hypothetical protein
MMIAGLREFVPGSFTVPQNPVTAGLSGLGCGCGGGCGKHGKGSGMGDLTSMLTSASAIGPVSLPNWAWIGGAAAVAYLAPWTAWEKKHLKRGQTAQ